MYFWCTLHPQQYQSLHNLWCSQAFMIHQRLYSRDCKAWKLSKIGLCGGPISTSRVSCPLWDFDLGVPRRTFLRLLLAKVAVFAYKKVGLKTVVATYLLCVLKDEVSFLFDFNLFFQWWKKLQKWYCAASLHRLVQGKQRLKWREWKT